MHYNTKRKLDTIRMYIQRHYKNWQSKYPNLLGAYPGEKVSNDKPIGRYSIVFMVSKKQKKPSKVIPKHFFITIPNQGKKRVITDVIEHEKIKKRNANLSGKIKRSGIKEFGTTGVFLIKGEQIYACTNSHVLLPDMIRGGKTHFFRPIDQQFQPDVLLTNLDGTLFDAHLQEGFFDGIDAAIARMDNPEEVGNLIPGFGKPNGIKIVQSGDESLRLQMLGLISGHRTGIVIRVGITIPTSIPNVFLHNLIETDIFTQKGDSGSPVFNGALKIIGIIYGGTSSTSLVIPIDKIIDTFQYDLLR